MHGGQITSSANTETRCSVATVNMFTFYTLVHHFSDFTGKTHNSSLLLSQNCVVRHANSSPFAAGAMNMHNNDPAVLFEQWRWRKMKISSAQRGWRVTREQAWASVLDRIQIANTLAKRHIGTCFPCMCTYTLLHLQWELWRGSLNVYAKKKNKYNLWETYDHTLLHSVCNKV